MRESPQGSNRLKPVEMAPPWCESGTNMFRIIYISGETTRFTLDRLEELLAQAREKNARLGITGLLLYKHGNFLQVIEGREETVNGLFDTIRKDPRHRRVIPVVREEIKERDFPDWSMAFREIDPVNGPIPPGFSDLLHIPWDNLDLAKYSDSIKSLVKVFMVATN